MTTPAAPATPAATSTRRRRRWPLIAFLIVIILPALAVTVWTLVALGFTYSSGERAGYIQKFSRKGWLCKTWEGELAIVNVPGSQPQIFNFTVRDDSVARVISGQSMGNRVVLHYQQHRGVPFTCLGETQYFVDAVQSPTPP
ncbi:MAG: 6-phosphogluconate dehydrogenase [Gemmatimonadaceae bacterium]